MKMKWDAVERDMFIIARQFNDLSKSFGSLATELMRERVGNDSLSAVDRAVPDAAKNQEGPPEEAVLPF